MGVLSFCMVAVRKLKIAGRDHITPVLVLHGMGPGKTQQIGWSPLLCPRVGLASSALQDWLSLLWSPSPM